MASNQDYLVFVLELLRELNGITYKKMMGEYILYKDGIIFGGIYDNLFLVKKTELSESLCLKEQRIMNFPFGFSFNYSYLQAFCRERQLHSW